MCSATIIGSIVALYFKIGVVKPVRDKEFFFKENIYTKDGNFLLFILRMGMKKNTKKIKEYITKKP
jgi:hypothetical protein